MIALQFSGTDADTDALHLEDFLKQMEAVKHAINETQRVLTRGRGPDIHYRVVAISRSSPYRIVLQADAIPTTAAAVATLERTFPAAAEQIQSQGRVPAGFDGPALRAYREMTAALDARLSPLTIESEGHVVAVTNQLAKRVGVLLGPKHFALGSVTGRLEKVNIHGGENAFWVYPLLGPKGGVRCHFRKAMLERVSEGVGRYVDVHGRLTYNAVDYFPEEVRAESMDVHLSDGEFPDMTSLRGIAPEATGRKSTDEFLGDLRDEAG
jgi:hypothetical protein